MILAHLKQATRARHAAIESQSVLLDRNLSRTTYHACLRRFLGYYAPLELSLLGPHPWLATGLTYEDRRKSQLLTQDLLALGDTSSALALAPQCHALPDLSTPARLFGCLYVIEGATLGGQIISRYLLARLGLTPQSGCSFFRGYGERTGSQWKAFGAHLTRFASQSARDEEIVAGANDTFETLSCWLYPA